MLTISTSKRRFTVKTEQEEAIFSEIVRKLIDKGGKADIIAQAPTVPKDNKAGRKIITREEAISDQKNPVEPEYILESVGGG